MKRLLAIALLCLPAFAATTVTDTVRTFDGSNFTGSIVITAPRMTTAGGATIAAWQKTYALTAGAFSASFEPNDTSVPSGTSYAVQYHPSQGSAYSEFWIIPTSGSPVTIATIAVSNAVTPSLTLLLSQLSGVGVTKGALPCFSTLWTSLGHGTNTYVLTADSTQTCGVKWAANSGGGGGGTWGSITGTLTDQTDLGTALSLKAALTANTFTRGQTVTGSVDEVQWDVSCNSAQTNPCARIRKSDGTVLFQVNNDGSVNLGSGSGPLTLNTIAAPGTPAAGKFSLWADSSTAGLWGKDESGNVYRMVPNFTGSTTNFLRADGTYATPPGGGGGSCTNGPWHDATSLLLSGWTGPGETIAYELDCTNRVWLRGYLVPGTNTNSTIIFILPVGFRPLASQIFIVPSYTAGNFFAWSVINITAIGEVEFLNGNAASGAGFNSLQIQPATAFVSLDGLSFSLTPTP